LFGNLSANETNDACVFPSRPRPASRSNRPDTYQRLPQPTHNLSCETQPVHTFGSISAKLGWPGHVRYAPGSDRIADIMERQFRARTDNNQSTHRRSRAVPARAGSASSKMDPSDSDLTSVNWPPAASTKLEEIASPNPTPSGFVVKNGSKMRSLVSVEIPGPESWTDINTVD
jgi:hypothetical protein